MKISTLQFGHGGDAVENSSMSRFLSGWPKTLQFGHGGDAVENIAATHLGAVQVHLQFGHGGDAVENPVP